MTLLGENMQKLRQRMGLNKTQFARELGLTGSGCGGLITKYESGKSAPTAERYRRFNELWEKYMVNGEDLDLTTSNAVPSIKTKAVSRTDHERDIVWDLVDTFESLSPTSKRRFLAMVGRK